MVFGCGGELNRDLTGRTSHLYRSPIDLNGFDVVSFAISTCAWSQNDGCFLPSLVNTALIQIAGNVGPIDGYDGFHQIP